MVDVAHNPGIELRPRICVIGVGGGGGNAVTNMMLNNVRGVEFVVANTDAQALNASPAQQRIQLGREMTQGLGAGAVAAIGGAAAAEAIDAISFALEGVHLCFIAAGMGGGTGTGAAAVIAEAARARGILTVGVVTKPFAFEGRRRTAAAEAGIEALRAHVDTLIVIPNQNLFRVATPSTTIREAFKMADSVLEQGVRSITDLIVMPGIINLDFADVRSVMAAMGKAMFGTGEAAGPDRAIRAAQMAISNPLLDGDLTGAKGLIISIAGGEDMRLMEVAEAADHIKELVDPQADIIWGSALDPVLEGRMRVSIVATGIETEADGTTVPSIEPLRAMPRSLAVGFEQDRAAGAGRVAAPPAPPGAVRPVRQTSAVAQVAPRPTALILTAPAFTPHAVLRAVVDPCDDEFLFKATDVVESPPAPSDQENWLRASSKVIPAAASKSNRPEPGMSLFQRMAMFARGGEEGVGLAPEAPEIEEPRVYRFSSAGRG